MKLLHYHYHYDYNDNNYNHYYVVVDTICPKCLQDATS